jgi:hypothetical protein
VILVRREDEWDVAGGAGGTIWLANAVVARSAAILAATAGQSPAESEAGKDAGATSG